MLPSVSSFTELQSRSSSRLIDKWLSSKFDKYRNSEQQIAEDDMAVVCYNAGYSTFEGIYYLKFGILCS